MIRKGREAAEKEAMANMKKLEGNNKDQQKEQEEDDDEDDSDQD